MDDLDTRFIAACAAGDTELINRLADELDALDSPQPSATLLQSALWYVEQGLKIFPLSAGSKIPFKGSRGCLDATNDPDVVAGWWERTPDANIGIATGHLVDVVDVDGLEGQSSRARHWDEIFSRIDADNVGKVLTPRPGGMHIYVPTAGEPNSTNIVPSVDVRGVGGYVVAPPSVLIGLNDDTPGTYRWLGTPNLGNLASTAAA